MLKLKRNLLVLGSGIMLAVISGCSGDKMGKFLCPVPIITATADSWPQPAADPDFEVKIRATQATCLAFAPRVSASAESAEAESEDRGFFGFFAPKPKPQMVISVESDVEIAGYVDVYRPGGAPRDDFSVDIFMAAVAPDDSVAGQIVETVEIDGSAYEGIGPAGDFTHEFNTLRFPVADGLQPSAYRLLIGFRLNEDQLAANRVRRVKRLSPGDAPSTQAGD